MLGGGEGGGLDVSKGSIHIIGSFDFVEDVLESLYLHGAILKIWLQILYVPMHIRKCDVADDTDVVPLNLVCIVEFVLIIIIGLHLRRRIVIQGLV